MNNKKLSISAFARLAGCTRQNISSLVKKELLIIEDKKLDVDNEINQYYLQQRKENPRAVTNPGKPNEPVKKENKIIVKKPEPDKKKKKPVSKKPPEKSDSQKSSKVGKPLSQQKLEIEIERITEQRNKLRLENAKARAELVEREKLAETCFGYLSALNQNIMSMPKSYIDDFSAGIKSKATRSKLTDILTIPICEAISETKSEIKKVISKAKKAVIDE